MYDFFIHLSLSPLRDRVPGFPIYPFLWALYYSAELLRGRPLRLQEGLALCWGLLALLSPLDPTAFPGLEQLWSRGAWHHLLCPVAPAHGDQCLIRLMSLHFLPAAAPPAHDLLLQQNSCCHQEGEFILVFTDFCFQCSQLMKDILLLCWILSLPSKKGTGSGEPRKRSHNETNIECRSSFAMGVKDIG